MLNRIVKLYITDTVSVIMALPLRAYDMTHLPRSIYGDIDKVCIYIAMFFSSDITVTGDANMRILGDL